MYGTMAEIFKVAGQDLVTALLANSSINATAADKWTGHYINQSQNLLSLRLKCILFIDKNTADGLLQTASQKHHTGQCIITLLLNCVIYDRPA